jgi:hypothetical protein
MTFLQYGVLEITLRSLWGGDKVLHYDGGVWTAVSSGTTFTGLHGLWGSRPDNVFAVGSGGAIVHYDGIDWSLSTIGTGYFLNAVWGASSDNVLAVGGEGKILNYNGRIWNEMVHK